MSHNLPGRLTIQSDADKINLYLTGKAGKNATLSPALQKKLDQLDVAADLLRKHGSAVVVAKALANLFKCSRATAYEIIGDAQEVLAPVVMQQREFYVDLMLGKMFQTHAMAEAKQDLKVMAATEKTIAGFMAKFLPTSDAMPVDKIQPPRMVIGFYPELVGKALPANWEQQLAAIIKTRKVGQVANQDADDVEDAQIIDESTAATA